MCSGKPPLARVSEGLGSSIHDIDRSVEERVGPLVPSFNKKGEKAFREVENELLRSLNGPDSVIATGGGTPCSNDTWRV